MGAPDVKSDADLFSIALRFSMAKVILKRNAEKSAARVKKTAPSEFNSKKME
jgi:hypothetical protein